MKTITILSGKGGVGKSSIAASLAIALAEKHKVVAADCDVDASNLALVLGVKKFEEWKPVKTNLQAVVDIKKCNSCKKCYESCYFNAIEWKDKPVFKEFGCEGCGLCELVCSGKAIKMVKVENAKIGHANTNYGFKVVSGQLEIGHSGSGKVVSAVRELALKKAGDSDFLVIDAAAGIGCPVIASVTGSDYVIAVTEPTPSGLSDLKRALQVVEHFKIPYSIIINKHDINPDFTEKIRRFAKEKVIAEIPFDKVFTDALINLIPIVVYDKKYKGVFLNISKRLENKVK